MENDDLKYKVTRFARDKNHMGGEICMGGHLFFTGIEGGNLFNILCSNLFYKFLLAWNYFTFNFFKVTFFPVSNFLYMYCRHHIKGNWLSEQALIWYLPNTNMATSGSVMTDSV